MPKSPTVNKRANRRLSSNLENTEYPEHKVDLYRQAARDLAARNSGLERYVVGLFGPDLMGSMALAFDPYSQFLNLPNKVSVLEDGPKVVRERPIICIHPKNRTETWKENVRTWSYALNPYGGLFDYIYTGPDDSSFGGTLDRGQQPKVYGLIRDTTRRTRPIDHTQGEFELLTFKMESRPRNHHYQRSDYLTVTTFPGNDQRQRFLTWMDSRITGPEFICTQSAIDTFLAETRVIAETEMSKRVLGMLNRVQPSHRTFSLAREIAELKDLPQTLKGTLRLWVSFERLVGRNFFRELLQNARSWRDPALLSRFASILGEATGFKYNRGRNLIESAGSAFLTFKFGWETLVRSIVQMLPSPAKVNKRVNELVNAMGDSRSFRTSNTWDAPMTSFPNMSTWLLRREDIDFSAFPLIDETISGTKRCTVRLMANFTINFPQLDVPRLRKELFDRLMGVNPSPGDIYDLIPWTWLADYFSGVGDYVHLLDSIHSDKSIINYGFITYREEGEVTATFRGMYNSVISRQIDGVLQQSFPKERFIHTGKLKYVYQIRRTIPHFANVKTYWGQGSLDPNQRAILGALFASRSR